MLTESESLAEIARRHGTDKGGAHSYVSTYERHLTHLRHERVTLLEIGIGGYNDPARGGASLRMWRDFFPRGTIVGVDINDKRRLADERISVVQGDQSDEVFLRSVAKTYGPFDIIIDDGSHVCRDTVASFRLLFDFLRVGGIYVVEDLQTSYWPPFGGSSWPGGRRRTTISLLKRLVDGLNYAEFDIPNYKPTAFDEWIRSISFYHNIAFLEKNDNREPSNILAPHPRKQRMHYVGLYDWRRALKSRALQEDAAGSLLKRFLAYYRRRSEKRARR